MKYLLFALPLCLLLACNNQPTDGLTPPSQLRSTIDFAGSPDQDQTDYVPLYIHKIPAKDEINNNVTAVGGFGQILAPPANDSRVRLLTESYWMIDKYADNEATRPQRIAATGQWIRCFDNGTFYGGHWDRQTHAGAWYLDTSTGPHPRLTLDSNVDRLDAIWELQAIANDGQEFAAVRLNEPTFGYPHRPFSAHWIKILEMPTKTQFADYHGKGTIK